MDRPVLIRRWITALLLLGGVIFVFFWGGRWGFPALAGCVVVLCQWEYQRLSGKVRGALYRASNAAVALAMPLGAMAGGERGLLMATVGCLTFWMVLETVWRQDPAGAVQDLGTRLFGYLYGALLPSFFVLIWQLPQGVHWILLTIAVTALGDTAAYYVGSLWGRHKLLPRVSPNKTVEGAAAGLAGNVAGALIYGWLFFPTWLSFAGLPLALLVGVAGQLGDLSESMLKRGAGVKDSGQLLPGHGGVLDRLDSLLFAAPVVFYWATS